MCFFTNCPVVAVIGTCHSNVTLLSGTSMGFCCEAWRPLHILKKQHRTYSPKLKVPKNKIMFQTHVDLIFSWLSCRLDSGLLTSCKLYFLTPANLRARAWGCPFQFLGANGAASDWPFNLPLPSASLLVFGLIKQPVGEIPMKRRDSYIYWMSSQIRLLAAYDLGTSALPAQ